MPTARYPLEDFAAAAGIELGVPGQPINVASLNGWAAIANHLGISISAARRRAHTGLDTWEADRAANALGRHPSEIWPDWGTHDDPNTCATGWVA